MNAHPQDLELARRYMEGTATAEETRALEEALRSDAAFRRQFLRYANVDAALGSGRLSTLRVVRTEQVAPRTRRLLWRPLAAAAAGLVIGLFSASMVFAYASPRFAGAKSAVRLLWSESFESGATQTLPQLPGESGVWSGDEARVVAAEAGLQPRSGGKMLRMVSTTFAGEEAKLNAWCDVYCLVDLRGQAGAGKSALRLSACFASAPFPAGEEYACRVELCTLEDEPAAAPQPPALPWMRENCAAEARRKFPMKGDGVWQEATLEVPVSPQTRFILVHLAVQRRRPHLRAEPVQFSGHYLDDVKLELLTQPSIP